MYRNLIAFQILLSTVAYAQGIKRSEGPERGGARNDAPTKLARQIPLWPKGAPGFENKRNEPEQAPNGISIPTG